MHALVLFGAMFSIVIYILLTLQLHVSLEAKKIRQGDNKNPTKFEIRQHCAQYETKYD